MAALGWVPGVEYRKPRHIDCLLKLVCPCNAFGLRNRPGVLHTSTGIDCTVVLIKFLPYSDATAQTRSAALWGVSGSYGQAPAQQGMSGLVRETSHLWLYSSPSPSLQPILREPATSILIVLYTFECIMWVATESLWRYVQGNKWILKLHFYTFFRHVTEVMHWKDVLVTCYLNINKQLYTYMYIYISVI